MIDFRYHLVSIVAVFLALAIGIVLGSTALQGDTIDGLKALNNLQKNQLNAVSAERDGYQQSSNTDDQFLQAAQPKLLADMLTGDNLVLVAEPNASSAVLNGIKAAAKDAGAAITGTITLQPKFNDLSGTTQSSLAQINSLATSYGISLDPATNFQTAYQQDAAQVIARAILQPSADTVGPDASDAQTLLKAYATGGYLTYTGSPTGTSTSSSTGVTAGRATVAVIVTPQATATDGPNDPADEVLLALAGQFATASAATLVAGPTPTLSTSPIAVLRGSSVSGKVSSVDNADTSVGQINSIWAIANQLQGGKPGSYGISSGAAVAVSPVPSPPSATPTVTVSPTSTRSASAKETGKVKQTVGTK